MSELYAAVALGGPSQEESDMRVNTTVGLFTGNQADHIIVTGNHWAFQPGGHSGGTTMGQHMANYAASQGVSRANITVLDTSLDTIGDALVVKHGLGLRPGEGCRVGVVTTASHVGRAAMIFGHVFGPESTIVPISAGEFPQRRGQRLYEAAGNMLTRAVFDGTEPGDDQAIMERLFALVPGYTDASKRAIQGNHFRRIVGLPLARFNPALQLI